VTVVVNLVFRIVFFFGLLWMSLRLEQVFSDEATRELELIDMLIADIPTSYANQTIRYQKTE
jgi:hypothetical protein